MTERNTPLEPVPSDCPIVGDQKISERWNQWLQRLQYLNSNKNYQTITGASTVNLDARHVFIVGNSVATYAITLAAPTQAGIFKGIEMSVYNSKTVTMALTNVIGGSSPNTCTWNGVNQLLLLYSMANKWNVVNQQGVTLT